MKRILTALLLIFALTGCDDSTIINLDWLNPDGNTTVPIDGNITDPVDINITDPVDGCIDCIECPEPVVCPEPIICDECPDTNQVIYAFLDDLTDQIDINGVNLNHYADGIFIEGGLSDIITFGDGIASSSSLELSEYEGSPIRHTLIVEFYQIR